MGEETTTNQNETNSQAENRFVNYLVLTYGYVDKGDYLLHSNFKKSGPLKRDEEGFLELYYNDLETLKTYISDEVEIAEAYHFYWSYIKPLYDSLSLWNGVRENVPVYRNKIPLVLFMCEFDEEHYTKMKLEPSNKSQNDEDITYVFSINPQSRYGIVGFIKMMIRDIAYKGCDFFNVELEFIKDNFEVSKEYISLNHKFERDDVMDLRGINEDEIKRIMDNMKKDDEFIVVNNQEEEQQTKNENGFVAEDLSWFLKWKSMNNLSTLFNRYVNESETLCGFLDKVAEFLTNNSSTKENFHTVIISFQEEWFTYQDGYFIKILHKKQKYGSGFVKILFDEIKKVKPSLYKKILDYGYIIHPIYLFSDALSQISVMDYSDLIRQMLVDGFIYDESYTKTISESYSLDTTAIKLAYTSIVLYGNEKEKQSIGLPYHLIGPPKSIDVEDTSKLGLKGILASININENKTSKQQEEVSNNLDYLIKYDHKLFGMMGTNPDKFRKFLKITGSNIPDSVKKIKIEEILAE